LTAYAQNSPPSVSPADLEEKQRAALAACAQAVEELKAARALIEGLEKERVTFIDRLSAEREITQLLRDQVALIDQEVAALRLSISKHEEAVRLATSELERRNKQLLDLDKRLRRQRRGTWITVTLLVGAAIGLAIQ
jgi:chromosome segregation ATPase